MKGTPRQFFFEETVDNGEAFTVVQVVSNQGDNCSVPIEVFG